ncbi:MAG: alpha/beta hydrolase [Prevotellaceae bacterium]|jgi:acetyl esterase/lipase|nr:alpha/beta hydrolase [Prevotellaceae bacterium]
MKHLLLTLCLSGTAFLAGAQVSQLPKNYTSQLNVVYTRVGPWEGKMDLYLPKSDKPVPVVVHIHGGGFTHGSKESQREKDFGTFFDMNFAVANISYRLAGTAAAPAAIEDARCAVAYLVQHASELNIDVTKIVTHGSSAGGHLALMAGLLALSNTFAERCPNIYAKVAAIVDICGPADLTTWQAMKKANKASRAWLGGRENDMDFVRSLSPITYVDKNSPPVFIAHGNADRTVPYAQSQALESKLKEAGVQVEFYTVENGGHAFSQSQRSAANQAMAEFLKKVLDRE